MSSRKHNRSPSVTSERSLLSLSDSVKKGGCKAKQKALKTVKSFTALLKKPRKRQVIINSDRKLLLSCYDKIFDHLLADTEPIQVGSRLQLSNLQLALPQWWISMLYHLVLRRRWTSNPLYMHSMRNDWKFSEEIGGFSSWTSSRRYASEILS